MDANLLKGLSWRSIGPAQFGGRVADVAGVPGNPDIIYMGHSTAGLFKSTNGGVTFKSVFNKGNTLSIGAIAISPANKNVVYIGTGEGNPRNSASFGDGVYKTTDGGKTWENVGLKNAERFSDIVINPQKSNIVYAAAMGHEWGPNEQRGVFRSVDGGKTWKKILYANNTTGASDIVIDPGNPNIIYAGMYDYMRKPWNFRSGGPGSGLYRSVDGGDSWQKLTTPDKNNGLPGDSLIGRIGIGISKSHPNVVYALIESQEKGWLWRSDDRGYNWRMVNNNRFIDSRPFYFTQVRVDPINENRVYTLSGAIHISDDGGRSFRSVSYQKMFGDVHALWIDPKNPDRLISGSDGGLFVSNDGAENFDFINTMPLAQAYHVGVDMDDPYHVTGGFQDHEIWWGPNTKWDHTGVRGGDWRHLRNWGDGMYAVPDPQNSNIVYYNSHFGDITRKNLKTGEERFIMPYPLWATGLPAHAQKYRFNWNAPIELSPQDSHTLYFGGNVVFKSSNQGNSWNVISPDLTTNDPKKLVSSGGPITPDNTRSEYYCTITTIDASPVDSTVIWAGTDDGNVQVTKNGGKSWQNVLKNMPDVPDHAWIATIKTSFHEPGTAYVAVDQHRMDNFSPYGYFTTDYGKTWTRISDGLKGYVHIISEDPRQENLLYAGTELGIFVSFDRGRHWTNMRMGLPPLPVRDLVVHPRDNDLIIATHARGFFILDDVTPLQKLASVRDEKVALFKPMRSTRYTPRTDPSSLGDKVFLGTNQPYGIIISYYINDENAEGSAKITIRDSTGAIVRSLKGSMHKGINRVVWNLRENLFAHSNSNNSSNGQYIRGPRVLPGDYTVQLEALGQEKEQRAHVRMDPNVTTARDSWVAQYRALKMLMKDQFKMRHMRQQMRNVMDQIKELNREVDNSDIKQSGRSIIQRLDKINNHFRTDPRSGLASSSGHAVDLQSRISWMIHEISSYTGHPTESQKRWIDRLDNQLQTVDGTLNEVLKQDIRALNQQLSDTGIPHIVVDS
ncbi:MAG TPA: hypothetical protein VJ964_05905 [Balneolaceae bacterium]|nr:hypothetical protein [Balneolaceae bacterium]